MRKITGSATFLLLLLTILETCGAEDCQARTSGFMKWSDSQTWPGQKIPGEGDLVTIRDNVVLDISPPPLGGITIEPSGNLVWLGDSSDIHLTVDFIHIKGRMEIGTANCPYTGKARITLTGEPGKYNHANFVEKYIGVDVGGSLELHGEDKVAWTKITKTINPVKWIADVKNPGVKTQDGGLVLYRYDPNTGKLTDTNFLFSKTDKNGATQRIETYLKDIPKGDIVGIGMKRRLTSKDIDSLNDVFETIEKFLFIDKQTALRDYEFHDAYAAITVAGYPDSTKEMLVKNTIYELERTAEVSIENDKFRFIQRSWVHTIKRGQCYVIGKSSRIEESWPVVDVVDRNLNWKKGDKVVITSTDFDWNQAEIGEVVQSWSKRLQVNLDPEFTHFGEIYKRIDMRAEIGVLTRNIVIEGAPTYKSKFFGGHIKFINGFKNAHVQNVELRNMGQYTDLGRYPLHFHMCKDNYTAPAYIRNNAIHHSFARCVTIHGTHGIWVENNLCYNTFGHGFFLEDGGEKNTKFDGNLGLGQRKPERDLKEPRQLEKSDKLDKLKFLIPSDSKPTTFWITNPNTLMRNNVAAGSDDTGIWYIFPNEPLYPSNSSSFMKKDEAKHTAISEFYNNVVHSNLNNGLLIDNILQENGKVSGHNGYDPWKNPLDDLSGPEKIRIERLTAYKNTLQNAWIRVENIEVVSSSFSDSSQNLVLARGDARLIKGKATPEQCLKKSVMVGKSPNIGVTTSQALKEWGRRVGVDQTTLENVPRQGFVFYQGPVDVEDSWFGNFTTTNKHVSGALGFLRNNPLATSPMSTVKGLQFGFRDSNSTGNRVFDGGIEDNGFSSMDGDNVATFRDLDGSVTSISSSVVKPEAFHTTKECSVIPNWKMAICPYNYGQLEVRIGKVPEVYMKRADDAAAIMKSDINHGGAPFLTILGRKFLYILYFLSPKVPNSFSITGRGLSRDGYVRIGICVPEGMEFDKVGRTPSTNGFWLKQVDEKAQIGEDDGYTYDQENRLVFVTFRHEKNFDASTNAECPGNECALLHVRFKGKANQNGNICSAAVKYSEEAPSKSTATSVSVGEVVYDNPPKDWGAGSTRGK